MTISSGTFEGNFDPSLLSKATELESELSVKLSDKVITHRNAFFYLIQAHYYEMLPVLITYKNAENTGIDLLKLEYGLRCGYDVAIGMNSFGIISILGYVKQSPNAITNPSSFMQTNRLTRKNIMFTCPDEYRPMGDLKEITQLDNCQTGDFIVVRNKTFNSYFPRVKSEYVLIDYYAQELAEIVTSRFSLIIQSKVVTVFKGEVNDETTNQLISAIYNGNPAIKASLEFDEDNILHIDSSVIPVAMTELKREYQNKISELNNILGINSLGVDKESGVTNAEANGNTAFTTASGNIYLIARQNAFNLLNKRFGLKIEAVYNDNVQSELSIEEVEKNENNNNAYGDNAERTD